MIENKGKRGSSRRKFLAASAGAAALIGGIESPAQVPTAPIDDDVTLALVNGRIHTLNNADTVASVVTIRNGRIRTVGGAAPKASTKVRVIDLHGRTVVPGLVEPHIHIVSL